MIHRKKRNSSKVNLTISIIFHSTLLLAVAFFAAREGMLGRKLRQITVTMVPKEKKPEAPREKPLPPKIEPPKMAEAPKPSLVEPPKMQAAAPVVEDTSPSVAPAAVSLPAFEFSDGAKDVISASDPVAIYKSLIEHALRSRWNRPDDVADDKYIAEVQLSVDSDGNITRSRWISGSGDQRWDDSVKEALAQVKSISRPPPKGFPVSFVVRFDVEGAASRDGLELSAR
jgi:hypothetical protein